MYEIKYCNIKITNSFKFIHICNFLYAIDLWFYKLVTFTYNKVIETKNKVKIKISIITTLNIQRRPLTIIYLILKHIFTNSFSELQERTICE